MKKMRRKDLNGASGRINTVGQSHESLLSGASSRLTAEDREKVIDYAAWLAAENTHNNSISSHEETSEYIEAAMQNSIVRGRVVRTFAPFHYGASALSTFTIGQRIFFVLLFLGIATGLYFFRVEMIIGIIASLTVFYIVDLLLMVVLSLRTLDHSCEEKIDDAIIKALPDTNWPLYTILCPLYHEVAVIPQFVRAIQALDYPTNRLQILFLVEEHDVETPDAIRAMNLPSHFRIMTVPPGEPRTKPRACNYGLLYAKGDYVVIYDAEDIPDPLQLKKAVLVFANHDTSLACVQAKLNFYNVEQNFLTRLFTAEYSTWFDLILPGLQRAKLALPLGGTSNHFRTATLGVLGAWDAFNVTEDCDLGLRLAQFGLQTTMLDSTTYEEANSAWKNWFRQRSRWVKGYMQTYLVHMRRPWRYLNPSRWRNFFSLQFFIGGKAAILLINPIMWLSLFMYIFFRHALSGFYQVLFPVYVLYMGSLCLIFGNFFYTYLHLVGSFKCGHHKIVKWAFLMPFYWLLASGAAYLALYQLIVKPHYWEKTIHGLHLKNRSESAASEVQAIPALNETKDTLA
jgi:cellulose synthase/poly-beta-1,6-N-acetylglucosamine synthase-like glycosyltransferase